MSRIVFLLVTCSHWISLGQPRLARVKVLFKLPVTIDASQAQGLLAYVQWFTTISATRKDKASGFYKVKPSMVSGQREASIIPATAIIRSCHLIPRFGEERNIHWSSDNVMDTCEEFFLNPFFDLPLYMSLLSS